MFPPGLEAIIVRALQLKPDERFRTADEMRAALEQWLVDSRHVVTATDIARTLSERMKPESLKAVNALKARKVGRTSVSFEALLDAIDDLEPPTAASGVVVPPFDLLEKSRSFPPAKASDLSDATEDATVRTDVRPQSTAVAGADKERSGWHRTGREDPTLTEKSRVASSAHQTTSGSPQRDSDHIATVVPPARSRPTPAWVFAAMVLVIALLYALWRAVR